MKILCYSLSVLFLLSLSWSCKKEKPVAFFTVKNSGCVAPCEVEFEDRSENAVTITWDFGDTNSEQNNRKPKHVYQLPGDYTVTLKASNVDGSDTHTETVKILAPAPPVADFTFTGSNNFIAPCTVNFTSSIQNAVSQQWDFGDSSAGSPEANPSHTYTKDGVYTVKLTAFGPGSSVTASKTVTIIDPNQPHANFSIENNNCQAPCEVTFNNLSDNADQYLWDFDDGTTSSQANPVHTYTVAGNYDVTLTVTGAGGMTNAINKVVNIQSAPNPEKVFLTKVRLTKIGTSMACYAPNDGKPDISFRLIRENGSFDVQTGIAGDSVVNAQTPVVWDCSSCELNADYTYYLEFLQHDGGSICIMGKSAPLELPLYNNNESSVNLSVFTNNALNWGIEIELFWQ